MIIKSLLDTDLYIFTMMQAIFHRYTSDCGKFEFKWRNWDKMSLGIGTDKFVELINDEVDALCSLKFTSTELDYLSSLPYTKPDFLEYLRTFQLNRNFIRITKSNGDGCPIININGPLVNIIMFEVPVLAIVSQLYTDSNHTYRFNWLKKGREKLNDKLAYIDKNVNRDLPFQFIEFGTRRRANVDWHSEMLDILIEWNSKYPPNYPSRLIGTSNVMFATKKGIDPRGTMAHLWFQIHQQLCRLEDSQRRALQVWAEEYRGELGIALSDTLGFDAFLCDFDRYFAMLNDGCRHDSGDPITWANKLIKHYEDLKIDPLTKQAVFSDGLTFEIAVSLFLEFYTRIKPSFGIGTYLTNDCGFEAPQIVIKNTEVNGRPTAKISDSPGKGMCKDKDFENYLKKIIRMRMSRR